MASVEGDNGRQSYHHRNSRTIASDRYLSNASTSRSYRKVRILPCWVLEPRRPPGGCQGSKSKVSPAFFHFSLVKRKKEEGPSTVRYEGLKEERQGDVAGGSGADAGAVRVHFGATGDRKDDLEGQGKLENFNPKSVAFGVLELGRVSSHVSCLCVLVIVFFLEYVTFGRFHNHYDADADSDTDDGSYSDECGLRPLIFRDSSGTSWLVGEALSGL